jgi:hypothetical protein
MGGVAMAHVQNVEGGIAGRNGHAAIEAITLSAQPVDGVERRISSNAVQYWRELAAPRRYPAITQVTQESAPALWEHLFLIKVGPEAADHVFVQAGSVLRQALECDPKGKTVAEVLPREIVGRALYFQKAACDLMAPIDEAGKWVRGDGTEILYRAVLLPLSDDQRVANYLLGAFSFRTIVNH